MKRTKDKSLRSANTELWASDYFWSFFTDYSYVEIMQVVLKVIMANPQAEKVSLDVPEQIIDRFEIKCKEVGLVDDKGIFNDPTKLVSFFCRRFQKTRNENNVNAKNNKSR